MYSRKGRCGTGRRVILRRVRSGYLWRVGTNRKGGQTLLRIALRNRNRRFRFAVQYEAENALRSGPPPISHTGIAKVVLPGG